MAISLFPEASLFLGIIPALILLYISLKEWQGEYAEKTLFIMFILGIALGFTAALIEIFTISSGIFVIVLFPILEQLMKTMVLNLRRYHGKRSSVIYGLSLGLGFGSIFTPVSMILANIETSSIPTLFAVLIGSIGFIFIHCATGALLGYAVFTEKLVPYFTLALAIHIPITLWFFITDYFQMSQLQIGIIVYGIIAYLIIKKRVVDNVLRQREKRKRTRQVLI
jgi:hypothetical protein